MRKPNSSPLRWLFLFPLLALLAGCAAPVPTPSLPTPAPSLDPLYRSNGGGEPRGSGYWQVWNTCAPNNQSAAAKANGGRKAGWTLLDDLLANPGVQLGAYPVQTCQQAVAILRGQAPAGANESSQPFFRLAAELLTAQLNLAVPSETCPAVERDALSAQTLLTAAGYRGEGARLAVLPPAGDSTKAADLANQLARYNTGDLCR